MKNLNWFFIALCSVCLFSLSSCHFGDEGGIFNCINGSGGIVSEEIVIDNFTGIEVDLSSEVHLTQGSEFAVIAEAEANILDALDLSVNNNGILKIKSDANCLRDYNLTFHITMPELTSLEIDGSSNIFGATVFDTENIKLEINGSGDIDLALNASEVITDISGSGKITLEGTADNLNCKTTGSGDVYAFELPVTTAKVKITGSGNAEVSVSDALDVIITGSGDVYYKGNPIIDSKITGSGRVKNKS